MRTALFAGAFAALTASTMTVLAQETVQSDPFYLKVVSASNATLDGRYLVACHTGAARTTLCLGTTDSPKTSPHSATFYWNSTNYNGVQSTEGTLVWTLRMTVVGGDNPVYQEVSSPMSLAYNPVSNVAQTEFFPGYPDGRTPIGFNNTAMYLYSWIDDAAFAPGVYPLPNSQGAHQLTNWYACWVLAGSYYYNALAWVTSGAPRNPTCQHVGVVKVDASA